MSGATAIMEVAGADPLAAIRQRLRDIAEPGRPILSIVHRAAEVTGIAADVLLSPSRDAPVCWVRFAIMLAACRTASQARVGRAIGRDHTSVIHGVKRARELVQTDPAFAMLVDVLVPVEPDREASRD